MLRAHHIPPRITPVVVAMALVGMLGDTAAVDAHRRSAPACPQADIQSVELDQGVTIDAVRVIVARRSPIGGAAEVRVDAGTTDRVVRVRGAASRQLSFTPPLAARQLEVSLDPVFEAPRSACVERIELWSGETRVAVVRPN